MFTGFIIGIAVGAAGMLLIYRNNQVKMAKLADKLNAEIADLKTKVEKK